MLWKIGSFEFCERERRLKNADGEIYLEPLLVAVLAYFCRHPGEVVERDQLVDSVWDAKAVTDNAVSRVVAKLRKALDDNPRSPAYILTYPKKGYQFIAPVTPLAGADRPHGKAAIATSQASKPMGFGIRFWAMCGLLVLGMVTAMIAWDAKRPATAAHSSMNGVVALTRGGDRETFPAVSPDGRVLAYSDLADDRMRLLLKDLETQETVEIGEETGFSGPAAWSPDGKRIAYLVTNDDGAFYYIAEVEGLALTGKTLIHRGPRGSYGKIDFNRHGDRVIFAEAAGPGAPYVLFEIDLASQHQRRLPQPELVLGGNSQFDVHPSRNALLISSPNQNQWLELFSLDLESDRLTQLFELQDYTCCPVWGHDGRAVVIKGEYPARTLRRFDLEGKHAETLLRVPHRISSLARFPNGRDFLYEGNLFNCDIGFLPFAGGAEAEVVVNSSVDDRLGVISPDGRFLAFVSERTGQDEIWLQAVADRSLRKLTAHADNRFYFDLQWSPDSTYLAGMTINQVVLVQAWNGQVQRLDLPQKEMRGLSWRDPKTISFSTVEDDRWHIFNYDIATHTISTHAGEEAYVHHAPNPSDSLWVIQEGQVTYGPDRVPLDLDLDQILFHRRFNLIKRGDAVYLVRQAENGPALVQVNLADGSEKVLVPLAPDLGFSVGDRGVFFTQTASFSSDIYRTTSE